MRIVAQQETLQDYRRKEKKKKEKKKGKTQHKKMGDSLPQIENKYKMERWRTPIIKKEK